MLDKKFSRRGFLAALSAAAAAGATATFPAQAAYEAKRLRIGYQKAASTLVLLKAQGTLEKQLAPLGLSVSWDEFPAGPQMLEAMNVGAIDFGYVGEAPPIFAQAAGTDFVYTAYEIPTPHAEGIVVQHGSPIQRVAELKGKRVAFNKGSDVHWFIIALLRKHGLDFGDIEPAYLAPADARAALEQGAIDAWAIWDPFLAAVERQSGARLLADAQDVVSHHQFFLTQRDFALKRADVIRLTMAELGKVGQAIRQDPRAAAATLAPIQGLSADIIEVALRHYAHVYQPIDAAVIAEQQHIADVFYQLKLIPRPIVTQNALLA
jgi:sulfonate transport system substrate-binding protein